MADHAGPAVGIANLSFESSFTKNLPADPSRKNEPRPVLNSAFSYVSPTSPVKDDVASVWKDAVAQGQVKRSPRGDPVLEKALVGWSPSCAALFDLETSRYPNTDETKSIVDVLGGFGSLWPGMTSYAMCYGGHQFGGWAGQLGDGRAISLGEYINKKNERWEIQLKGAGKTPYSRFADGRAVLRSSIREFLCSEAMHSLNIPTTRALSLVTTGTGIIRDMFYDGDPQMEAGAVVARVAPSFLRLGNFQLATSRDDTDLLTAIADYAISFHFPEFEKLPKEISKDKSDNRYVAFLREVVRRNAEMIAKWQGVGFVHGVMNTDNFSILGLTIDYGPYGFLDEFDPEYTPNTTDIPGKRYRYNAQPMAAYWNITQFAKSLVPLCGEQQAIAIVTEYETMFKKSYGDVMRRKLGLVEWNEETDLTLLQEFQTCMLKSKADFTNTWRALSKVNEYTSQTDLLKWGEGLHLFDKKDIRKEKKDDESSQDRWLAWLKKYQQRIESDKPKRANNEQERVKGMNSVNPVYILRNYIAQTAIERAEKGDYSEIKRLYELLSNPFTEQKGMEKYTSRPPVWASRKGVCVNSCSS